MSWAAPQTSLLPDGKRLHLHHGPIDLIIEVFGEARDHCYEAAIARFQSVLTELVDELDALRRPVGPGTVLSGSVARRMVAAVRAHPTVFVTPMAAVAGAVSDEVLSAICAKSAPIKAYVNNGGDIAFHLAEGAVFDVASPAGQLKIASSAPSRGIATSGWQGRSHSLGIADAVTVAASNAADADVAATLIANAIDLPEHPAIQRSPAHALSPDSDLGYCEVTTHVGPLSFSDIEAALDAGQACATRLHDQGLIHQAALTLQGQSRLITHKPRKLTVGDRAYA